MIDATRLVQEEIRRALAPPPGFTVHNATDEAITVTYDAETMTIPAIGDVIYPAENAPDVFFSAKDADGDWIPGTLVIRNKEGFRCQPFGDRPVWLAATAIKHCLGIDVKTGEAHGPFFKRGLSVMPANPTKEMIHEIRAAGLDRYDIWRVQWAKETVEAYSQRANKWRSLNLTPEPPPIEFDIAQAVLERDQQRRKTEIAKRFGKEAVGIIDPVIPSEVKVSKEEVLASLLSDPDSLKALFAKLKEVQKEEKR